MPGSAAATASESSSLPTILIVDDDVPFCRAAAELLADQGFNVIGWVTTAEDAVIECGRQSPDTVLLDVHLPDGYGVELVTTLRSTPRPPRVVLTSSDSGAVLPDQLRAAGANGFVPKVELTQCDLRALVESDPAG